MKKIIMLLLFIFLFAGKIFSQNKTELVFSNQISSEVKTNDESTFSNISCALGGKVYTKYFTSAFYYSSPKINAQDFSFETFYENSKITWGVKALPPSIYGVTSSLYLGSINFSGSLSRIKNPVLTARNPLGTIPIFKTNFSPSLPDFSTGKKNFCSFVNLNFAKKTTAQLAFEFDKFYAANIQKKFNAGKNKFSLSFTQSYFLNEKKFSSSWFSKDKIYPQKYYSYSDTQFDFIRNKFYTSFTLGLSEHPFENFSYYIKNTTTFSYKKFILSASVYNGSPYLISANGSNAKTSFQAEINPRYVFKFKSHTINCGASYFISEEELFQNIQNTCKAQISFQNKKIKLNSLSQISFSSSDFTDSLSFASKLSFSMWNKNLSSTSYIQYKYYDSTNELQLSSAFYPKKNFIKQISTNYNLTVSEKKKTHKAGLTFSVSKKTNSTQINAKINFEYILQTKT